LDFPEAAETADAILQSLDEALQRVREVSQGLAPSLVYRLGLQSALEWLMRERQAGFRGTIGLKFSPTVKLDPELGGILFDAIDSCLTQALARPGSSKVSISVTANRRFVTVRIQDNGRKAAKKPQGLPRVLAEAAGFLFSQTTRRGTIVLIRHGISRSSRG
jgi:signal transduction histidine kinase